MNTIRLVTLGLFAISMAGCVSYKKNPLVPEDIFGDVEKVRQESTLTKADAFGFPQASEWMSVHSPELRRVKARYETVQSVADIPTPWLNPSLEIGPKLGSNLEAGASGKTRPFVGLGFTIPLGGRLRKNDDLNRAKAMRAFIEAQARHRELYLELREVYTHLFLALRRVDVQQNLVEASQTMLRLTRTLRRAGATTALDVGMIELDSSQVELEWIELHLELEEWRSRMSILLGVDASRCGRISKSSLPSLDRSLPTHEDLKAALVGNHLGLARLRFDYEIAEKNLRLEISKQYPDIHFGAEREKEVGEDTVIVGLRIGIDIPIFDRNQHGIAQATKEREEVRKEYIATVHQALSELKKTYENVTRNQQRKRILVERIQPRAEANLEIAKRALESGGIDALKYLDVLRTYQETVKNVALMESDVHLSWLELEKVVGFPLVPFPGETPFDVPLDRNATAKKETSDGE